MQQLSDEQLRALADGDDAMRAVLARREIARRRYLDSGQQALFPLTFAGALAPGNVARER